MNFDEIRCLMLFFFFFQDWLPSPGAQCRFIFDGEVVKETDTPVGLDLEEGDQIEVHYL